MRPCVRRGGGRLVVALLATAATACSGGGGDERGTAPAPAARDERCTAPTGTTEATIRSGGVERTFVQVVPDDPPADAPLVIALHGYGASGAMFHLGTGFVDTAGEHGVVVLAPDALADEEGHPSWDLAPSSADVRLVEDLIDLAVDALCVDPGRVHVTGHSQGGFLISTLACTSADRITSVATVAGLREAPGGCAPDDPVPLLAFHDRDDPIVPYAGGLPSDLARRLELPATGPSIPDLVDAWTERNPGAIVELRTTDGVGHGWPSEANEEIWAFFSSAS